MRTWYVFEMAFYTEDFASYELEMVAIKKPKLTPQLTHHPHDDEIITNSKHIMPSQSWFKSVTLLSKRCHLDQY